jgi:hypothetical protein
VPQVPVFGTWVLGWPLLSVGFGGWPGRHSILGFDVRIVDQHPILVIYRGVGRSRSAGAPPSGWEGGSWGGWHIHKAEINEIRHRYN